ncbi:hypothetical protein, partial [Burkholderia pseudomallei]
MARPTGKKFDKRRQ